MARLNRMSVRPLHLISGDLAVSALNDFTRNICWDEFRSDPRYNTPKASAVSTVDKWEDQDILPPMFSLKAAKNLGDDVGPNRRALIHALTEANQDLLDRMAEYAFLKS